jgi:hypothetical protein
MGISSIHGLKRYIKINSGFSRKIINDVIIALGYNPLNGSKKDFKELSGVFEYCVVKGANTNIKGFRYGTESYRFFQKNRREIAIHLQLDAAGWITDLVSLVQRFKFFNNKKIPWASDIEKALWDTQAYSELADLYNAFSWYTLEEIAKTWYRYLEENPDHWAKLTA